MPPTTQHTEGRAAKASQVVEIYLGYVEGVFTVFFVAMATATASCACQRTHHIALLHVVRVRAQVGVHEAPVGVPQVAYCWRGT